MCAKPHSFKGTVQRDFRPPIILMKPTHLSNSFNRVNTEKLTQLILKDFKKKVRITQRKGNQKQNYFNPLLRDPAARLIEDNLEALSL